MSIFLLLKTQSNHRGFLIFFFLRLVWMKEQRRQFCLGSATSFLKPLKVATLIFQCVFSGTTWRNKHECGTWSAQGKTWGTWGFYGELRYCVLPYPFTLWGRRVKGREESWDLFCFPLLSLICVLGTWPWWVDSSAGDVDSSLSLVLQRVPNWLLRVRRAPLLAASSGFGGGVLQEGDL